MENNSDANRIKMIETRLDASKQSLERTRTALWILIIISLIMIFAAFNQYFSWDRDFALASDWPKNEITKEAHAKILSEWASNQTISIGLLGIRVSGDDASFIGSISLLIVSYWLLFCSRRQNHTIALLLRDTTSEPYEISQMIFHGVLSNLVFLSLIKSDRPFRTLEKTDDERTRAAADPSSQFDVHNMFHYVYFLPTFAIVLLLLGDMLSIFWLQAPFRHPHDPLWRILGPSDWFQVAFWDLTALAIATWTYFICRRAVNYEHATGAILKEYGDQLRAKQPAS